MLKHEAETSLLARRWRRCRPFIDKSRVIFTSIIAVVVLVFILDLIIIIIILRWLPLRWLPLRMLISVQRGLRERKWLLFTIIIIIIAKGECARQWLVGLGEHVETVEWVQVVIILLLLMT
jgi:hypothetical protein